MRECNLLSAGGVEKKSDQGGCGRTQAVVGKQGVLELVHTYNMFCKVIVECSLII